jgi:NADH-quinone oxidoreductase subunit G
MAAATASTAGLTDGAMAVITGPAGSVTLPVRIGDVMDGVVWVPANAVDCSVTADLGAAAGTLVTIGGAR